MTELTIRLATPADLPDLRAIMAAAIAENLKPFLSPELIRASQRIMGLDTALIEDGTYWIVLAGGQAVGSGGWSWRRTLYGGDHTEGRDDARLDPAVDAARVRAMYTHPSFVRRGVGRLILARCEAAAAAEGFGRLELVATLAGEPLYRAYGFQEVERFSDGGVPLIRMAKPVETSLPGASPPA
jgi:GNAT superfamily N-acetyltransferase